jgi:hypothetical protein
LEGEREPIAVGDGVVGLLGKSEGVQVPGPDGVGVGVGVDAIVPLAVMEPVLEELRLGALEANAEELPEADIDAACVRVAVLVCELLRVLEPVGVVEREPVGAWDELTLSLIEADPDGVEATEKDPDAEAATLLLVVEDADSDGAALEVHDEEDETDAVALAEPESVANAVAGQESVTEGVGMPEGKMEGVPEPAAEAERLGDTTVSRDVGVRTALVGCNCEGGNT